MAKREGPPGIAQFLQPQKLPATFIDVVKALQPFHFGRSLERRYGKKLTQEDVHVAQVCAETIYGDRLISYDHLDHAWHGIYRYG